MKKRVLRSITAVLLVCVFLIQPLSPLAYEDEHRTELPPVNIQPLEQPEDYEGLDDTLDILEHTFALRTARDLERLISADPFALMVDEIRIVPDREPEHEREQLVPGDTTPETKEIVGNCLKHNEPYVKCGAVIGLDGIKKIMASAAVKFSGRKNIQFFYTKERALEWLLQQK